LKLSSISDPQTAISFLSGRPAAYIRAVRHADSSAIEFPLLHFASVTLALAKNRGLAANYSPTLGTAELDRSQRGFL
jgi:hypothetical protein